MGWFPGFVGEKAGGPAADWMSEAAEGRHNGLWWVREKYRGTQLRVLVAPMFALTPTQPQDPAYVQIPGHSNYTKFKFVKCVGNNKPSGWHAPKCTRTSGGLGVCMRGDAWCCSKRAIVMSLEVGG